MAPDATVSELPDHFAHSAVDSSLTPSKPRQNSESQLALNPPAPTDDWVRAHYGQIHRAAWMMTGDAWAADDLAQETFVVAVDKWANFDGRSTRATWLYGILMQVNRRRSRTLSRLAQRLKKYALQNEREQSGRAIENNPAIQSAVQSWRQSVWSSVAQLPPAQSEAITLRYAQELTYDEIASAIGCPVGTVKTRIHHGLKKLRSSSSDNGDLSPDLHDITPPTSA